MAPLAAGLDWSIFLKPAFDGSGTYLQFLLIGVAQTSDRSLLPQDLTGIIRD